MFVLYMRICAICDSIGIRQKQESPRAKGDRQRVSSLYKDELYTLLYKDPLVQVIFVQQHVIPEI
jgi:hypothetical protein